MTRLVLAVIVTLIVFALNALAPMTVSSIESKAALEQLNPDSSATVERTMVQSNLVPVFRMGSLALILVIWYGVGRSYVKDKSNEKVSNS